tara:strand:+ start:44 stop:598 length:555 start_codon:yes stop_codon:yes gene_type:complete
MKVPKTFRIDPEILKKLNTFCASQDRTYTWVIEKALVAYIGGAGGAQTKQVATVAKNATVEVVAKKESKPKNDSSCEEIISYLNSAIGKNFKCGEPYKVLIRARMKEGYSLSDFKSVIDKKAKDWLGSDSAKYLRPQTLFGTKFDAYLNQVDTHSTEDSNQVDLEAWLNSEPDQSGEVFENGHY